MCGRYYRRSDKQRIGDAFNISDLPSSLIIPEDYNVEPTTFQPVIRNDKETGDRELVLMRWGLVPFFTKQLDRRLDAKTKQLEFDHGPNDDSQSRECLFEERKLRQKLGFDTFPSLIVRPEFIAERLDHMIGRDPKMSGAFLDHPKNGS